jgi:hypothetical protein
VVAKLRERLAVSKQAAQKFDGEKFNLRKLNELEVKIKYQIEITNRFTALENLNTDEDVNRAWETIKENVKASAKESLGLQELKQHKPWFDQECLGFLDQRKQAKMQWIQDPNRDNVDNLNNVRHDASRHFRNKKKAYLRAKIEELEANSKIKNISSRLVTLLKVIDAPIQVPNIFYLTVSFKFLNFSFQICLIFVPEMSDSITSYIVQIIYIVSAWILYPLQFGLLPLI